LGLLLKIEILREKNLFLNASRTNNFIRRLLLAAALLLPAPVVFAAPTPEEDMTLKISAVKIEGNKNVSSLLIYGHLIEKEGDPFSARRVRMDIHNLFSMGDFKDVKVDAVPGDKAGQVVLTFKVVEQPLVNSVQYRGNRKWDANKFKEEIKTAAKNAYDPTRVNGDIAAIRKLYLDEGYSNVVVSARTKPDEEKNTVDVTFVINEGVQIKVGGVTVIGSEAFSGKKVADQLKDNHEGEKYKPDTLDADLRKIEDFYHDEGYLKAVVVDHSEKMVLEKKRVFLTITVKEGEKYTLGEVKFHGNVLFDDEDMLKALNLKKGELLRKKDLDDGTKKMKTLFADKGYIYSNIASTMDYDDELKKVNLAFEVVEGQVAFVQDVKIVGNYKTRDYVIRREMVIEAGDKFEAAKIRLSAQNLYNLGFFDEVNPEVEPGDAPGKEVLVFRVKERHTGSISVGGGYSSVDGFVGNVKLEEANLFGKGQRANLEVEFGASRFSFNVGFTEPWLFNTRTSLSVNLFDTTRTFTNSVPDATGSTKLYDETQIGGSIGVGRRLDRYWSVFGTYSLQNVQISNVGAGETVIGTPNYIPSSSLWTSSVTPRIVYDSRDNYFDPTTGWKHQLSVEFAGGPMQGDSNFIKILEDTSHFIPLPADFVFGEHVRFGAAQGYWFAGHGYTDVPVFEKFYAGGTDTVRGYTERSVGGSTVSVTGGNALFVSNTEIKHVIAGPLRGVLFFDAGDAWTTLMNIGSTESNIQMGTGLGVRLTIPGTLIAIRLDYGFPINTNLSASAAPPGGTLHFNLGDIF